MTAGRDIIFWSDHAAQVGADSQSLKVVASDHLHPYTLGPSREAGLRRHEPAGQDTGEHRTVAADLFVHRVGMQGASLRVTEGRSSGIQPHQLLGVLHGQQAVENLVQQAENRGVGPDSQRQAQHRHQREARAPAQSPKGVEEIPRQRFQLGEPALLAMHLLELRGAAQLEAGLAAGLVGGHPEALEIGRQEIEVGRQLGFEFPIQLRRGEQRPQPPDPAGHFDGPSRASMRPITADRRFQFRASVASCLRPAWVIA